MLFSILSGGDIRSIIINLLLTIPVVLMALSFHEAAHALIAYKLGDRTAYNLGRVTMNPIKHLDPFGFLCMLLVGFGWAKPVPINTRYFKNPKRDMAICGLAGPIANLLLALIFAALFKGTSILFASITYPNETVFIMAWLFREFLSMGIILNVGLAVFNLLPIPPLDGSRLLTAVLPWRLASKLVQYERVISLGLMVLLFFGKLDFVLNWLSGFVLNGISLLFGL